MAESQVEEFRPTSGRVMGVVGLLVCAVVVVYGVFTEGFPAAWIWVALVVGVLVWSSFLRPGVAATSSHLVLRNMLSTVSVPLAAIEQVVVGQVLAVRVGEKRYVSPAIGKSWRQAIKGNRRKPTATSETPYPVFVEERISRLASDARDQAGVALLSDEQLALASDVRRQWAWPEIGALALATGGLLVAVVLV